MKRSGPPKRKTPLASRTPLRGSSAMKRSPMKRSAGGGRARPNEQLAAHCQAVTPVCVDQPSHRHHRQMRSQLGGDDSSNTLDVCKPCHTYIHNHPAESYERGWLLHAPPSQQGVPDE